ncbi:MAG: hypothetical protein HC874_31605 [Richelia sp. SL_2_1]|nr:hypothetical protein [Richelia sp. SM1_7_0]NJN12473.1 hypothetical protein [Richelia sp. RM1_1_1]NJO31597.1 hypothetical protein [Richelia sp. SL_2_1]
MRGLKSSPQGLKQIKEARERRELAIEREEWLDEASNFLLPVKNGKNIVPATVSIGTWKRFLQGTPVKPQYFKAFCQVLQLDWEEVVETEEKSSTIYDWDGAPNIPIFSERSKELHTLKQWLTTINVAW